VAEPRNLCIEVPLWSSYPPQITILQEERKTVEFSFSSLFKFFHLPYVGVWLHQEVNLSLNNNLQSKFYWNPFSTRDELILSIIHFVQDGIKTGNLSELCLLSPNLTDMQSRCFEKHDSLRIMALALPRVAATAVLVSQKKESSYNMEHFPL
jgi:hypothetical protein